MKNPFGSKDFSNKSLLDIGELGAFNDCGMLPHSILKIRDKYVMYYTGWSKLFTDTLSFYV
jgi:hypothetical protein